MEQHSGNFINKTRRGGPKHWINDTRDSGGENWENSERHSSLQVNFRPKKRGGPKHWTNDNPDSGGENWENSERHSSLQANFRPKKRGGPKHWTNDTPHSGGENWEDSKQPSSLQANFRPKKRGGPKHWTNDTPDSGGENWEDSEQSLSLQANFRPKNRGGPKHWTNDTLDSGGENWEDSEQSLSLQANFRPKKRGGPKHWTNNTPDSGGENWEDFEQYLSLQANFRPKKRGGPKHCTNDTPDSGGENWENSERHSSLQANFRPKKRGGPNHWTNDTPDSGGESWEDSKQPSSLQANFRPKKSGGPNHWTNDTPDSGGESWEDSKQPSSLQANFRSKKRGGPKHWTNDTPDSGGENWEDSEQSLSLQANFRPKKRGGPKHWTNDTPDSGGENWEDSEQSLSLQANFRPKKRGGPNHWTNDTPDSGWKNSEDSKQPSSLQANFQSKKRGGPEHWTNDTPDSGGENWKDSQQSLSLQANFRPKKRGGPNYWTNDTSDSGGENWEDSKQPSSLQANFRPKNYGRDDNTDERRDHRGDRCDHRGDSRDHRGDIPDHRGDRRDRFNMSSFTPRDRVGRTFSSNRCRNSPRYYCGHRISIYRHSQVQDKELANPVPLGAPFLENPIRPGTHCEVTVTSIRSPEDFYAQTLSFHHMFKSMMRKIPELYKRVSPFSRVISVGASVLARYPADGVLYRATVLAVQPCGKYIVHYVDYGNKTIVEAKDIFQLDSQLLLVPKMAVRCSLVGVAPIDGEWRAGKVIDSYFNAPRYQCIFLGCVDGVYKVSLSHKGISVADMLVENFVANEDHTSSIKLNDEIVDCRFIKGQQMLCRVTHVESWDKFYIQLDLEKAAIVEEAMANFNVSLLTPLAQANYRRGNDCIVKHRDKIYRAKLVHVAYPTKISVVLTDYGNTITLPADNVMILPKKLRDYCYQSSECNFNNFTAESIKLMTLNQLKETLTGNTFIVYINDIERRGDEVYGPHLVTTLYDVETGKKVAVFEPDKGAYDEVIQLCTRAVYDYVAGVAYLAIVENLYDLCKWKSTETDRIEIMLNEFYAFYQNETDDWNSEELNETLNESVDSVETVIGNTLPSMKPASSSQELCEYVLTNETLESLESTNDSSKTLNSEDYKELIATYIGYTN